MVVLKKSVDSFKRMRIEGIVVLEQKAIYIYIYIHTYHIVVEMATGLWIHQIPSVLKTTSYKAL